MTNPDTLRPDLSKEESGERVTRVVQLLEDTFLELARVTSYKEWDQIASRIDPDTLDKMKDLIRHSGGSKES